MIVSFNYKFPLMAVFLLLNVMTTALYAADISVHTDRNPVSLNESFQLVFTANEAPDGDPDFTPLEKDFDILSRSQQQSTQIINLKMTKSIQWLVTVMARRAGNLIIPAISFGKDSSPFSALTVNEAQPLTETNSDLFLQVEVNTNKPYIQQQVLYTLKFYRKVNIAQAQLTEPTLPDAVIEKLGEDKNYKTEYQGESYVVTERLYALFPQKSGTMTIAPLKLTADVVVASQPRFNGFFNRQSTHAKRVESKEIILDVQPKPAASTGSYWLPAEQVYIEEKWSTEPTQMSVGEPVTRTLTVLAKGLSSTVLPELNKGDMPTHVKAYADQPVLKESVQATGMIAFREEKVALIAGQAGRYTLPAIEIPWWNTVTQKMEVARIAERTITAIAATNSGVVTNAPIITQPVIKPVIDTDEPLNENAVVLADSEQKRDAWFWLAIFFACAWVITLVYFLAKNTGQAKKQAQSSLAEKSSAAAKKLKQACVKNNPLMAKDALLQWGRESFQLSSLAKIADSCDEALQNEIMALNIILYSDNSRAWQGGSLWRAFQENTSAHKKKISSETEPLAPLFKI